MREDSWFKKLISPPQCISCGKILRISSKKPYLCRSCLENLYFIEQRICPTCLKPLDIMCKAPYCAYCSGEKFMFKYLIGVSKYGASIKNAILNLKFRGKSCYSESLAKMIFDRIEKLPEKENFDTIVYAPISYQRFKQRGYNQAKLIAYELSKLLDVPVTDALVKIRDTVPQSSLSYKERKTNLKNSIVPRVMLDGMNILLVDDVYTTGATAEACIQALKASNAKSIVVAVAAISGEDFYDGKNNII